MTWLHWATFGAHVIDFLGWPTMLSSYSTFIPSRNINTTCYRMWRALLKIELMELNTRTICLAVFSLFILFSKLNFKTWLNVNTAICKFVRIFDLRSWEAIMCQWKITTNTSIICQYQGLHCLCWNTYFLHNLQWSGPRFLKFIWCHSLSIMIISTISLINQSIHELDGLIID